MLSGDISTVVLLHRYCNSIQALLLHSIEDADHPWSEENLGETNLVLLLVGDALLENGRANRSQVI